MSDVSKTSGGQASPVSKGRASVKSTGKVVTVPKTPAEIAQEGTDLSAAGDDSTGGNPAAAAEGATTVTYQRIWAMDSDHTTRNRNDPDALHPDAVVEAPSPYAPTDKPI